MRVTILGCGGSMGVPTIGNHWGDCDPAEPRNYRTRPSILIETDGKTILVDAGPDLRTQLLAAKVTGLDAVIFTHAHADHTMGIDDLRMFSLMTKAPVPIYGTAPTIEAIHTVFAHMFKAGGTSFPWPFLSSTIIAADEGLPQFGIATFAQQHRVIVSLGIECGGFAYSTDISGLDEVAFAALQGIDCWVVAALRREAHPAHATLATVLQWIERVKPRRAILTHMSNSMDYATLRAELPPHVEPAYDGMVLDFA